MRDELLQHVRRELSVADVEAKIRLPGRSHIHLAGQIVLHYCLGGIFEALKIALHMGRREHAIAIDVDEVDIRFGEPQQGQFFAGLAVFRKVTVFANVTCVLAVAGDTIVLHKALAAVLTGIGSLAGVYVVAVVQGNLWEK